jgi:hypothetical protein
VDDSTLLFWVEKGKILAGFFVAIGVAGEFLGDFIASPIIKRRDLAQQAEIAQLNREAGEARKAAGDAMERAASLQKQAEDERLARMKIEGRLAVRTISEKDYFDLIAALKPHGGAVVEVSRLIGDMEAEPFGARIISALEESGWSVRVSGAGVRMPPVYGLQCAVNEGLPAGRALAQAFKSLPTAHIVSNPELPVVARIVIGLKPPP